MNYHEIFYNNIFLNCYYDTNDVNKLISIYNIIQMILIRNISKFPNITFINNFTLNGKNILLVGETGFGKIRMIQN